MVERTIIIGVKSIDELGLRGKIAIIGIAKGSKSFYGDSIPLYLDKKSETLKLYSNCETGRTVLG
jgi:hypothetical protein